MLFRFNNRSGLSLYQKVEFLASLVTVISVVISAFFLRER